MSIVTHQEYQWSESFSNSITKKDINLVIKELEVVQKENGDITPELVVELAKNKQSILHDYFEWNNKKAADSWRLQQASNLLRRIEVTVVKDGEPLVIRAYEISKKTAFSSDVHYKRFDLLTEENIELIKKSILSELSRIKNRLDQFTSFNDVSAHIGEAIEALSKESTETKEGNKPALSAAV